MSSETLRIKIKLDNAAKFAAEARAAGHEIEVIGNKADKAGRKAKSFGSSLDLVNKTLKVLRPAGAIASVAILGQVLSAGAAGGVAFVASLVPLIGLLGALPAAGLIAAQGLGVLTLGLMGVKDAVGGLNEQIDPKKFAGLSRPAQDFVLALDGMKSPLRDLQQAVQSAMLPGFTRGLKSALPALTALQGPLTGTGQIIGNLGARLGKLVGSRGFLSDLRSQVQFNNVQINRLGGAGLHLVNVLRNLAVASRPLVSWIVRMTTGWAAAADRATATGRANGKLAAGFHTVRVTLSRVFRIAADVAKAFFNIGRIGKRDLGDGLLVSLVRGADALRQWTESGPGMDRISQFFTEAKPVVFAVARLIGDVATQILRFGAGSGGGLIGVLNTFDSMVKVVGALADLVGPSTVVYAFLAMKGIGVGLAGLSAFATGMRAITVATGMATTAGAAQLGVMASTKAAATGMWLALTGAPGYATKAAAMAGAAAGGAYGRAFRAAVLAVPAAVLSFGVNKLAEGTKYGSTGKDYGGGAFGTVVSTLNNFGTAPLNIFEKLRGHKAMGGPIWKTGAYLVGERGPEVVNLRAGDHVTPNHDLGPRIAAPRTASVRQAPVAAGAGMGGDFMIEVRPQPIYLEGRQVAEVTADAVVKHASRA